jgi:glycosyltransferase involved in cell wall biosynthesis
VLSRAIDSVLAQTRQAEEILVVDDGSTDGTGDLLARYGSALRVLTRTNAGAAAARNLGIRHGKGEWLAFLDSDDAWLPEKLARQLSCLDPDTLVAYTNEIWIRRGRRVNAMKKHGKRGGLIFEHCLPLCIISPSSVIIHRRVFDRVGLFDETLPVCEDFDLWLRICARYPVHFLDESLIVKYGGHADQLSRRYWGLDRFRIQALEKIVASETLKTAYRLAALDTLLAKLAIYAKGARKRGKLAQADACERKGHFFRRLRQALRAADREPNAELSCQAGVVP